MRQIEFPAAFEALTGSAPFVWQRRLHADFLRGDLPGTVDLPTGLGKTSVIAIWLLALAAGAPLPRRLIYVVDRRTVVDQATVVAGKLREGLTSEIAAALGLGDRPLPISTLRGGLAGDRSWMADPSRPAIVVGTVDMIGSRLLFEGYGVSRATRPMEAALLGCDALLLLDEAHLSTPLLATARAVAQPSIRGAAAVPAPLRTIALSATAGADGPVFSLQAEDREDLIVVKRLAAEKRLRIEAVEKLDAADLARRAWEMAEAMDRAARVLVFTHARDLAGKVRDALAKEAGRRKVDAPALLLVGGRRGWERDLAARDLVRLGFLAGDAETRDGPAFLVATSAGEVGVDLDADAMICDLVAWERMVQRLGRVNRRGGRPADVLVLDDGGASLKAEREDEKTLRAATRSLLGELPLRDDGAHDASPGSISALRGRPDLADRIAAASTPPPLRPDLTRPLVEAWAMTGLDRHPGRPEPGPWLRGWIDEDPATEIAFREILPVRRGPEAEEWAVVSDDVQAFMDAAPPQISERLEATTDAVLRWLLSRTRAVAARRPAPADPESADAPGPAAVGRGEIVALAFDRARRLRRAWRLADLLAPSGTGSAARRAEAQLRRSLADGLLVVDARLGGLNEGLLDEKADAPPPAADVDPTWRERPADPTRPEGRPMIPFRVRRFAIDDIQTPPAPWRRTAVMDAAVDPSGDVARRLEVWGWRDTTEAEAARAVSRMPQALARHQAAVEAAAREIARAVGLPPEEVEAVALAARLHDEGKAAEIWQDAMGAPAEGRPWAKTGRVGNGRALLGYRHEFGSLLAAEARLPDGPLRDLTLHLIAAHHGRARPIIRHVVPATGDPGKAPTDFERLPPKTHERAAGEAALRFARLQRRHGPWGLAFREAVLRAADWRASADEDGAAENRATEDGDG